MIVTCCLDLAPPKKKVWKLVHSKQAFDPRRDLVNDVDSNTGPGQGELHVVSRTPS